MNCFYLFIVCFLKLQVIIFKTFCHPTARLISLLGSTGDDVLCFHHLIGSIRVRRWSNPSKHPKMTALHILGFSSSSLRGFFSLALPGRSSAVLFDKVVPEFLVVPKNNVIPIFVDHQSTFHHRR